MSWTSFFVLEISITTANIFLLNFFYVLSSEDEGDDDKGRLILLLFLVVYKPFQIFFLTKVASFCKPIKDQTTL